MVGTVGARTLDGPSVPPDVRGHPVAHWQLDIAAAFSLLMKLCKHLHSCGAVASAFRAVVRRAQRRRSVGGDAA